MINFFYESLPKEIILNDYYNGQVKIQISTDFRDIIKVIDLMKDSAISQAEKVYLITNHFDKKIDKEALHYAISEFSRFISMEDVFDTYESPKDSNHDDGGTKRQSFSYSYDFPCIYAAFLECYNIDLIAINYMHWWKFRMLFDSLPEKTEIKQRIYYRNVNLSEITDTKERARIRKIQASIYLPENKMISDYEIGGFF